MQGKYLKEPFILRIGGRSCIWTPTDDVIAYPSYMPSLPTEGIPVLGCVHTFSFLNAVSNAKAMNRS